MNVLTRSLVVPLSIRPAWMLEVEAAMQLEVK